MRNKKLKFIAGGFVLSQLAIIAVGCQSWGHSSSDSDSTTRPISASAASDASTKGGAQLWEENCSRCHNLRPPQYYSDQQWAVVVQHMRFRANLTGQEQRKITEFLQASN